MKLVSACLACAAAALAASAPPRALAGDEPAPASAAARTSVEQAVGLRYSEPKTYQARFAIQIRATRAAVRNVIATCPLPVDWPEQQVRLVRENKPAQAATSVTDLPGMGAMLVVRVPAMPRGATVTVERVYEITRSQIELVGDPAELRLPQETPREIREYLRAAPDFDDRGRRVERLAESLRQPDDTAWQTVRRHFDWVRENVTYQEGDFRGPRAVLEHKVGDCEDMTALFVALCRSEGVPARDVWVEGHAYPEFYLEDRAGHGHWIPAQVSGPEWFGRMADYQPILQKGDRCRDPLRRRDARYIPQSARASGGPVELSVTRTLVNN